MSDSPSPFIRLGKGLFRKEDVMAVAFPPNGSTSQVVLRHGAVCLGDTDVISEDAYLDRVRVELEC